MKILSRACLIVCASCVIGITVKDSPPPPPPPSSSQQVLDDEDDVEFDLEQFGVEDDEEEEQQQELEVERLEAPPSNRALEPEAEMLPAGYKGIKPPGVDHMEMTRSRRPGKKAKPRSRLAYRIARQEEEEE